MKFPTSSSIDWAKIAAQELNGADPFAKLSRDTGDFFVKPYYDRKNVPQDIISKQVSDFGEWLNAPKILVTNTNEANKAALAHLNAGADAILFDLKSDIDPAKLLSDIELNYCSVFFILNNSSLPFVDSFRDYLAAKQVKAQGAFYFSEGSHAPIFDSFRSNGLIVEPGLKTVDKISSALQLAAARIDLLTNSGVAEKQAIDSIAFLWHMEIDFFKAISELKALRVCWSLFVQAYGVESSLFLHAISPAWIKEDFQPHGNMLKQTTTGLAAVLGNSQAVTLEAEDQSSNTMVRAARNISSILKEESHLDKVVDPLAGSYFMEEVTTQMASEAWRKFQEIV